MWLYYVQMELFEFKEPLVAELRTIQREKAQLEEVGRHLLSVSSERY